MNQKKKIQLSIITARILRPVGLDPFTLVQNMYAQKLMKKMVKSK
jgi:hypothetical protein